MSEHEQKNKKVIDFDKTRCSSSNKDWREEFDSPDDVYLELEKVRENLAIEKTRNAYFQVTGKSIADIKYDGIHEMIFALDSKNNLLNLGDIESYSEKLLEENLSSTKPNK